ncbi:MAG: hypothetical protein ABI388_06890 [Bacteroidia bacterium]
MKFCFINIKNNFFLVAFIGLFFPFSAQAQTSTSSPYSRYGIGSLEPAGLAASTAMGGCYTAFQNDTLIPLFINPGNPASYSTNRITTFEIGGRASSTNFISDAGNVKKTNSGFNYISLAVPIRKNMGLAAGLTPFSNVGYNATTSGNVDSIGQVNYNYQGTGGINKAFLGFAIRPFDKQWRRYYNSKNYRTLKDSGYIIKYYQADKNDTALSSKIILKPHAQALLRHRKFWLNALSSISIGTNLNFLYGSIDYYSYAYFPYSYGSVFNTKQTTESSVHDIYYQGGAQMAFDIAYFGNHKLKKTLKVILGYTVSLPKKVAASASQVAYTFSSQTSSIEQPYDTFYNKPSYKGSIYIPMMQSFGLGFKHGDNLTVLFDVGYQQWSKYSFFGDNQKLRDSYSAAIGIQLLPKRTAVGNLAYLKRINYRIGARYNSGNLVFNNHPISLYAVTGGIGLPSGGGRFKLFTMVNISAEYGVNGTTADGLIKEKYIRFALGLTFNDRWFIKTKYD